MLKRMMVCCALQLLLLLAMPPRGGWALTPPEGFAPGPDVIMGNLPSLIQAGSNGTQVGLMMGTDICNNGDVPANWFRLPETDHPVIPQNLYRLSGGANNDDRFEQIGQSWAMHQFFPLQNNACGFGCTAAPDSAHLGVGCSTADSAGINASQSIVGSRAWINPFTGIFPSTANTHTGHTHDGTTHRILVEANDLNTMMNQGATYYGEAQLVTPHEYAWCQSHAGECNMFNNVSYRQFMVAGTTSFNFSPVGATVRTPAIFAWPGATIQTIEPEPGVDGRAFIAYKVTCGGGLPIICNYEYAIYNQNLDRGIQSFSVPGGCGMGTPGNLEFHAPLNHPGIADDGTVGNAGYSNTPWTAQTGAAATWSTETFAQNPNANALRWGTLYNFRFQAGTGPTAANATIGFFKTGAPIIVPVLGPFHECQPSPSPSVTPPPTPTATPSPSPTPTPCQLFFQNFDNVFAPAMPPGWSGGAFWVTSTTNPDTPPNCAFVDDPAMISDREMLSPPIFVVSASSSISFRNNYDLEAAGGKFFDGGVLEVSVNGGPFSDVTDPAVGGSFSAGGYTGEISGLSLNPLAGRMAWSGNSGGYINTVVNFGPNLNGQSIRLKFRMGSDSQGAGGGWRIDTMTFSGMCGFSQATPTPTASPTPTPTPSITPTPTPTSTPGGSGKIAFQSTRNGNDSDICVMNPDGSNLTNLTANLFQFIPDRDPDWSPDGTKIVFSVNVDEFSQDNIYVMDANGANAVQLTSISKDFAPVWSPDGKKIAFGSYRDGNPEIYVMNADGSNPINLTNNPAQDAFFGASCGWSPDGTKIAFTSNRGGNGYEIYVMAADGSNQVQLTNTPGDNAEPDWSPDGTKIAFTSYLDFSARDIYVMNADGSNPIRLTNSPPGSNFQPNWSQDGTRIVFTSTRKPASPPESNFEIYVMNADGSNQTNLTNFPGPDARPDWQPIPPPPTPTPTPTSTPSITPTPTPSATPPTRALNLSTRMFVQTADRVGIGGFIITGTAPKHVLVRAIGPSLTQFGLPNALADTTLELHGPAGFTTIMNDNWRDTQETAILATGIAPTNNLESAIDATLPPGAYTGVVRGKNNTTGVALVEVYDLNQSPASKLANMSTRAFVLTGDNIVIAGFVLGGNGNDRIVVRGLGPSMSAFGIPNPMADPTLELRDNNGALLLANNDWQDDPDQAGEINAAGLAPASQLESALIGTFAPGLYTALLAGRNNGTGSGLVEVYDLGPP